MAKLTPGSAPADAASAAVAATGPANRLLAVDLGLHIGLALFGDDGRLLWHRSRHFGSTSSLRDGVRTLLGEIGPLGWLVLEGGDRFGNLWRREGERRGATVLQISAEVWRRELLLDRDQRQGNQAKDSSIALARRVIAWSGARNPPALRHDSAEAILVGLWGALAVGLLPALPRELGG